MPLDYFYTPVGLKLDLNTVVDEIIRYIEIVPDDTYTVIIGTDSVNHVGVDFVSAVVVYRLGHGGRFFWKRVQENKKYTLRNRIYQEALMSLKLAESLVASFAEKNFTNFNFEIHVDIGNNGPTRELIQEITGMIRGSGFNVKTKPESYGASSVADRLLK